MIALSNPAKTSRFKHQSTGACLWALVCLGLILGAGFSAYGGELALPGPVVRSMLASPVMGEPVPWSDGHTDYLAVGDSEGFLNLFYHVTDDVNFGVFDRQDFGGGVQWVGPWTGGPYGSRGLVVATRDPDTLFFVEIAYSLPYIRIKYSMDLPEDPGTIDFIEAGPEGQLQLALSLPGVDQVLIVREQGAGWVVHQTLDSSDEPSSLVAIDLDNDQDLEFVTANRGVLSGKVSVYSQGEDGDYFLDWHQQLAGHVWQVGSEDFNLDGQSELVVSYSDLAQLDILQHDSGSLIEVESLTTTQPMDSFQILSLPMGQWGLAGSNESRGLLDFFRLSGAGWEFLESYFVGCRPQNLASCDLNGDGINEIVSFGTQEQVVSILLGNTLPAFWGYPSMALSSLPLSAVQGDFDGDSLIDFAVVSIGGNSLSTFLQQADTPLFSAPVTQNFDFLPRGIVQGDFLGDSRPELVVMNAGQQELLLMSLDPGQGFVLQSTVDSAGSPQKVSSADIDSDGFLDLILAFSSTKEVKVLFGQGDGSFHSPVIISLPLGVFEVEAADLNSDSQLELVVSDGSARVWTLENLDGRSFGSPVSYQANTGCRYLEVVDLDQDLDLDLVVANTESQSLSFFKNLGNGNLERIIGSLSVNGLPTDIASRDMDGDQINDVVVPLAAGAGLAVVLAQDFWQYIGTLNFTTSESPSQTLVGDFSGDGVADVLSFDSELLLAIVMVNTERALVAVDPTALSLHCDQGQYQINILPDRTGPWALHIGQPGDWHLLAQNGDSDAGRLHSDGRGWVLMLNEEQAGYPKNEDQLRLTVGAGTNQENLYLGLSADCFAHSVTLPQVRWLDQPWPNPFNPRISGRIQLNSAGAVEVSVFDTAGRKVATLLRGNLAAGVHNVSWNGLKEGHPAAAGLYFMRIQSENALQSRKIMLLK